VRKFKNNVSSLYLLRGPAVSSPSFLWISPWIRGNGNRMSSPNQRIAGRASAEGTERYSDRFPELDPDHFRLAHGMLMSSIGIGTYLGDPTAEVDQAYADAISLAVCSGCNVIDSAINYRFQRSERSVAVALRKLLENGFSREEIVVCTKGGFLPFDGDYPANPRKWVEDELITPGVITAADIVASSHCMTPAYLRHQLARSLENLGVDMIDIYYIHNPETQLTELSDEEFYYALEVAFAALEEEVAAERICSYGIATWDALLGVRESPDVVSLDRVVECARRAGGDSHHFRFLQLPVNLAMPAGLTQLNQEINGMQMTPLEAARSLNISAVASASLLQAQLTRNLPLTLQQAIPGLPTDAARSLQFSRSAPGITTALVGMSSSEHVRANLDLASLPPMSDDEFGILFGNR
jgi:aryl-alcohol dehydrogenase-like predicted oxidoreductase